MIETQALRRAFTERFTTQPKLFCAPGRVNLIGEHTDYNDGYVLPMAIERVTCVAGATRADRRVRVLSLNQQETLEFDLDRPGAKRRGVWLDYVEGVAQALEARGVRLAGADLTIDSDVPIGAGLSSSAALEVSTGLALATLSGNAIDKVTLALAGQAAEHEYVGAKVGIMDQFIAAMGRRDHALLIDCRTLEAVPVPLDLTRAVIAICNTRVKHELAGSEYNTRRAECEQGVELLRAVLPGIKALRDVSSAEFAQYEHLLPEPIRRRCRHVITENERTLDAVEFLRRDDMPEFGRLMYESHKSLRDDYEVSCAELDLMVQIASTGEGVWGARMTGGGFGGCTVNLVRRDALESFQKRIHEEYKRATGIDPIIYISAATDGAHEVRETPNGEFVAR